MVSALNLGKCTRPSLETRLLERSGGFWRIDMDRRTLELLEYEKIQEMLAAQADTSHGESKLARSTFPEVSVSA